MILILKTEGLLVKSYKFLTLSTPMHIPRSTPEQVSFITITASNNYNIRYKPELLSLEQNKNASILNRDDIYKYGGM